MTGLDPSNPECGVVGVPGMIEELLSTSDLDDYAVALDICEEHGIVLDLTPLLFPVMSWRMKGASVLSRFAFVGSVMPGYRASSTCHDRGSLSRCGMFDGLPCVGTTIVYQRITELTWRAS